MRTRVSKGDDQLQWSMQHDWDVSPKQGIMLQKELREHVITEDRFGDVQRIAGVDVGFEDNGRVTRAAVAVLAFPGLELVEDAIARRPTCLPYIPGLLSFREVPALLAALERLTQLPDMILCDGQGYAHPRRFGLACHLGVITDIPAVGVAKTRLIGQHDAVPEPRGQWTPLVHKDQVIGAVLRTREGVKPLFISAGHRIGLRKSIEFVMACVTRYRLPETTRHAHRLASG